MAHVTLLEISCRGSNGIIILNFVEYATLLESKIRITYMEKIKGGI